MSAIAREEQLKDLAVWCDIAAGWLEGRALASRDRNGPALLGMASEQVAFKTVELDALLTGFRRTADSMLATTTLRPLPRVKNRDHLRVVK
jgi:hypothetical protein